MPTMKKAIALVAGLTLLVESMPVKGIAIQQPKTKTFAQWCQQKNAVPATTKLTIDLLLKQAGTKNCALADSKISSLTELNLSESGISDLKPLSGLTKLTSLSLYNNKISDLQPLSGLTKLIDLNLNINKISNVKPLARLSQLKTLYLQNNQISDTRPLSKLSKLESICLFNNKIVDKNSPFNREDACKL
jgi:internalin A